MIRSGIRKLSAPLLFTLVVASVFAFPAATSFAQTAAKKVVKTQDDLPRFNYAITGTVTELLNSDDASAWLSSAAGRAANRAVSGDAR
jgi:hypothetical protein